MEEVGLEAVGVVAAGTTDTCARWRLHRRARMTTTTAGGVDCRDHPVGLHTVYLYPALDLDPDPCLYFYHHSPACRCDRNCYLNVLRHFHPFHPSSVVAAVVDLSGFCYDSCCEHVVSRYFDFGSDHVHAALQLYACSCVT